MALALTCSYETTADDLFLMAIVTRKKSVPPEFHGPAMDKLIAFAERSTFVGCETVAAERQPVPNVRAGEDTRQS